MLERFFVTLHILTNIGKPGILQSLLTKFGSDKDTHYTNQEGAVPNFLFFFQIPIGASFYPSNAFVAHPKTSEPYRKVGWCRRENIATSKREFIFPFETVQIVE